MHVEVDVSWPFWTRRCALLPTGISGTVMAPIWPANFADVSVWLPLNEVTMRQTGSILVEEWFPDEEEDAAPGPVVTGVNVPFSGNVVGGGIGLHVPPTHFTALTNCSCTVPISRSTDRSPEVDLRIAEAGTRAAALVEVRSGGSGGGTTGHGVGGGTAPP